MRRSGLVFIAALLANIIALAANLIIANILEAEYFGVFKIIIYLFAFLPMFAELGISSSLTKYIAEFGKDSGRSKYIIRWFLKLKLISYTLLILIIFLMRDYIATYFLESISMNYLILSGIILLSFNYFSIFSSIVLGFQNFKLYSLSQFLSSVASASFAVLLSPLGIFYMVVGWGLGILVGNIPNLLFLIKKTFKKYEAVDMKRIFLRFSLPSYPTEFITSLFTIIIPFLSFFFSKALVGYYSFAFMFYYAALLIPNSLSIVLFPKFSELDGLKKYGHAKNILKRSFLFYSLVVVIGIACVFLLSEWFIAFVAKDYLLSLPIFKVIVSLGLIFGYNSIYTNYLRGLGRVKKYALLMLIQNIVLIVASFILLNSMM